MELRVLNYFLIVAREENITKAAQLLHITQPTLSRQIAQLEEELDVKLFRRSNHSIILTEEGSLLKRRAQEIVALTEKTKKEFSQKQSLSGEISIGCGELQSTRILSEFMTSFREKHTLVKFEVYSGNSDNIKDRIENGNLDFGLLLEPVDIRRYDFIRMPVKEEWGVLVNENSELAKKKFVTPESLIGMSVIFTQREPVQNELNNWFGPYSDKIEIVASGNLQYNLAVLARSEMGVLMGLKLDCKYDGLRFIPLYPKLESSTVLVWKKTQPFSHAAESFIQYVKKCLNDNSYDSV